jgi:hypothetical protein
MNTPLPSDALFQMERRIAQRADDLARRFGVDRGHALDHWRQAEREVWQDAAEAVGQFGEPDLVGSHGPQFA